MIELNIKLQKNSSEPLYQQVVDQMIDLIDTGVLKKGTKLESEDEISEALGISRGTIRKALKFLESKNYLNRIHGKGTFVGKGVVEYPLSQGLLSFAESIEKQGLSYKTIVLKKEIKPVDKKLSKKLGISTGEDYFYMERLRMVGDENLMLIENRLNLAEIPGLPSFDYEQYSLFEKIEESSNKSIAYSTSSYEAVAVDSKIAKLLGMKKGEPILKMNQAVYLDNGSIIDYGTVWLKGNKYFVTTSSQRH